MDDNSGEIIRVGMIFAIIAFVVLCIIMLAAVVAGIVGAGGLAWGGGTAIINYGKSFKENMIDSNRAAA